MISLTTAMAGQHHDVNGRMRVEPEHVLEQHRIAAQRRIEDSDLEDRSTPTISKRDREHRRGQHENHAGRVHATR